MSHFPSTVLFPPAKDLEERVLVRVHRTNRVLRMLQPGHLGVLTKPHKVTHGPALLQVRRVPQRQPQAPCLRPRIGRRGVEQDGADLAAPGRNRDLGLFDQPLEAGGGSLRIDGWVGG